MARTWRIGWNTRIFNGKQFTLKYMSFRKSEANKSESKLRKQGNYVRVTKTGRVSAPYLYLVWARPKPKSRR